MAGIDRVDEPVASLLGRFEAAAAERLAASGVVATPVASRLGNGKPAATREEWLRKVPFISWTGHLMTNPASILDEDRVCLNPTDTGVDMVIHLDTAWDSDPRGAEKHAVRELVFPLVLSGEDGAVPVIDEAKLREAGAFDVVIVGDAVQVVMGPDSEDIVEQMNASR